MGDRLGILGVAGPFPFTCLLTYLFHSSIICAIPPPTAHRTAIRVTLSHRNHSSSLQSIRVCIALRVILGQHGWWGVVWCGVVWWGGVGWFGVLLLFAVACARAAPHRTEPHRIASHRTELRLGEVRGKTVDG